jgi:hypothetical protein
MKLKLCSKPLSTLAGLVLVLGAAHARPTIEGMSQESGRSLLATISARISQYIPGKLALEEIDSISPAPMGQSLYLISARKGRLVALTDEQVMNVVLLSGYVRIVDGRKVDVLASVREKAGYEAPPARPATPSDRVVYHPSMAIPMSSGSRIVHVVCDPSSAECARFQNEILKVTPDIRAYIYPVSVAAPGGWKEHSVRDLMCWPASLQFAQWDLVLNASHPVEGMAPQGVPCRRSQMMDEMTARMISTRNPKPMPILTTQDGRSLSGAGSWPVRESALEPLVKICEDPTGAPASTSKCPQKRADSLRPLFILYGRLPLRVATQHHGLRHRVGS